MSPHPRFNQPCRQESTGAARMSDATYEIHDEKKHENRSKNAADIHRILHWYDRSHSILGWIRCLCVVVPKADPHTSSLDIYTESRVALRASKMSLTRLLVSSGTND